MICFNNKQGRYFKPELKDDLSDRADTASPDGEGLCEWSPVSHSPVVPFRGRQWGEVKPRYDTLLEQSYVCYIYNEKLDGLDPVNIQTLP